MRWRTVGLCALGLMGMTGCPETFGRGGRVDQAMHKDSQELSRQYDCPQSVYEEYCLDNEQSEECEEQCGG